MIVSTFRKFAPAVLLALAMLSLSAAPQDHAPRMVTHRWAHQFSMVTPAFGQTLRIHVVRLGLNPPPVPDSPAENTPVEPPTPPDPCKALLVFYNSQGEVIGTPLVKTLDPGKSAFSDLNFSPPTADQSPPDPCRVDVLIFLLTPEGKHPPDPCRTSLELLDTASGRVSVHMQHASHEALPAIQR